MASASLGAECDEASNGGKTMRTLRLAVLLLMIPAVTTPVAASNMPGEDDPGVYLRLVDRAPATFDEVAQRVERALFDLGWQVLEPIDCGVDAEKCEFRSRVLTAYHPDYAGRVMEAGAHAAFAVPVRFAVFEDEYGVHVAATNPQNLNRTIVDEATAPEDWTWASDMIREVGRRAFPEEFVEVDFGQRREDARIGKTMGVMAGGAFVDQIETIASLPAEGTSPAQIADLLLSYMDGLDGDWEWGIHPVYVMDLPEHGVSVVGVSGRAMEAKAFDIVGSGGADERKDLACPGVDHAAAFPIELLVSVQGDQVTVRLVDEMYRMKMFFEDAGKWAFMKNMGMPGSIEDEIRNKVRAILN
jgi:uncharacterized protein (DUF302 family)